jgi:hypothetical protein
MSLILFVVPQLVLKAVTKEVFWNRNIIYLVFACILPLLWVFLPREVLETRTVNFLQHAIGGGVAVGFVSIYFLANLGDKFPSLKKFFVQIIFVYALVCMMGVANELLEFLLDYFSVGIFSSDRYDTWYDLLANTTGAVSIYLVYKIFKRDL